MVVLAIKVLAPFAPHMAEELWHYHQQKGSVTQSIWPQADERYLQQACANYAVQVNGKLKAVIECELGLTQEAVLEKAMALPKIVSLLQKPIRRVIFVQDKLLNLVI